MSYLKMALRALAAADERGGREAQTEGFPDSVFDHNPPAQPANLHPCDETPKVTPSDHILTCFVCPHFQPNNGPNPRQAWGHCEKRNKGRYGVATACEAILTPPDAQREEIQSSQHQSQGSHNEYSD
jgi:hypothetical protein